MLKINIEKGKEILCLKFANADGLDCIQEHQKIMNELGYVWLGKIGNKPAYKTLYKMVINNSAYILLKESKKAYICQFKSYSERIPYTSEYPNYYNTEISPNIKYSIWFKLTSIIEVNNIKILDNIVVKSSRSPILETMKKSMASHFNTITIENIDF